MEREGIVYLLKEEIKRIASEEVINVSKLHEYTQIYERLKAYEVTSVQEVGETGNDRMTYEFRHGTMMSAPMPIVRPTDNLGGLMDIFKEAVLMQKPKVDEIFDYMSWVHFLNGIKDDIMGLECADEDEILENIDKLMIDITKRIVELMRKRLEGNIAVDGKTSDKISEVIT